MYSQSIKSYHSINCLGVVLAGGLSSRMGQDKAQLLRQKKTTSPTPNTQAEQSSVSMLNFSKQLLLDAGITDIVTSGDNFQIPDCVPHAGPVGGIYSVLAHFLANSPEHLQPKALLILPVDLPLMTASAIAELRLKGELSHKATFFCDSQKQSHHIPLYLPNNAFLAVFLAQTFRQEQLLANASTNTPKGMATKTSKKNGPSVRSMLAQVPHQSIISQNKQILFNTNTPQQWQQAKQQF
ncbi:MAG: NTP transferase domain-containing protein [Colwellia sp.]